MSSEDWQRPQVLEEFGEASLFQLVSGCRAAAAGSILGFRGPTQALPPENSATHCPHKACVMDDFPSALHLAVHRRSFPKCPADGECW